MGHRSYRRRSDGQWHEVMSEEEERQQRLDELERGVMALEQDFLDMKAAWTVFMHLMADHLHKGKVKDE